MPAAIVAESRLKSVTVETTIAMAAPMRVSSAPRGRYVRVPPDASTSSVTMVPNDPVAARLVPASKALNSAETISGSPAKTPLVPPARPVMVPITIATGKPMNA